MMVTVPKRGILGLLQYGAVLTPQAQAGGQTVAAVDVLWMRSPGVKCVINYSAATLPLIIC